MREQKGDLAEIFRRGLSGSLSTGDVVKIAGYPESRDESTVRVVRDGKVIAIAHYHRFSAGWLEASGGNCTRF